jgi:hypothetical protein
VVFSVGDSEALPLVTWLSTGKTGIADGFTTYAVLTHVGFTLVVLVTRGASRRFPRFIPALIGFVAPILRHTVDRNVGFTLGNGVGRSVGTIRRSVGTIRRSVGTIRRSVGTIRRSVR